MPRSCAFSEVSTGCGRGGSPVRRPAALSPGPERAGRGASVGARSPLARKQPLETFPVPLAGTPVLTPGASLL